MLNKTSSRRFRENEGIFAWCRHRHHGISLCARSEYACVPINWTFYLIFGNSKFRLRFLRSRARPAARPLGLFPFRVSLHSAFDLMWRSFSIALEYKYELHIFHHKQYANHFDEIIFGCHAVHTQDDSRGGQCSTSWLAKLVERARSDSSHV